MSPIVRKPPAEPDVRTPDEADPDKGIMAPMDEDDEQEDPGALPAAPGQIPIEHKAKYVRGGVVKGIPHFHKRGR